MLTLSFPLLLRQSIPDATIPSSIPTKSSIAGPAYCFTSIFLPTNRSLSAATETDVPSPPHVPKVLTMFYIWYITLISIMLAPFQDSDKMNIESLMIH